MSNLLHSQIVARFLYLLVDAQLLANTELINASVLLQNAVFLSLNIDNLANVQAADQVLCDDVRRFNHQVVNILTSQSHEQSLLKAHQGELIAAVVANHLVGPNTYVQVVTLGFRLLESFDDAWVEQIATRLVVNDLV